MAIPQTLVMVGKFEEAEKLARASLALREKDSAPDSYRVQSARATVGSALVGQKRFAEAEPLLEEGCAHFKKLDAAAVQTELVKLQMRNRGASLVQLYEATGRPEKAAEWRQWSHEPLPRPPPRPPAPRPPPYLRPQPRLPPSRRSSERAHPGWPFQSVPPPSPCNPRVRPIHGATICPDSWHDPFRPPLNQCHFDIDENRFRRRRAV